MAPQRPSWRFVAAAALCCVCFLAEVGLGETFEPTLTLDDSTSSETLVNQWLFLEGGTIKGSFIVEPPTKLDPSYPFPPVLYVRLLPYPVPSASTTYLALGKLAMESYATSQIDASLTETVTTDFYWQAPAKVPVAVYLQYLTNHTVRVKVRLVCTNPGGVSSSATVVSLANVYATAAAVNIFIAFPYIFLLARNQKGKWPPKVLTTFGVIMLFKCASTLIQFSIYLAQQTGSAAPDQLSTVANLIDVVVEIVEFGALLVLCLGYTLVRKKTATRERRIAIATFVFMTLVRFASFICQLPYLSQNCDSVIISDTIARLASAGVCMAFLDRLVELLRSRLSSPNAVDLKAARVGGDDDHEEPLTRYASIDTMLRVQSFRVPVAALFVTPVIRIVVLAALPSTDSDLIATLITQMTVAFIFVIVAYHFATLRAPVVKED